MEKGQLPPWKIGQTLHRFMIRLCFICSYRNISTLINKLEQTIEFEKKIPVISSPIQPFLIYNEIME